MIEQWEIEKHRIKQFEARVSFENTSLPQSRGIKLKMTVTVLANDSRFEEANN